MKAIFSDSVRVHQHIFAGPQPGFMMAEQITKYNALLAMETGSFEFETGESKGEAAYGDLVFCPAGVIFKRKALSEVSFHHIQFEIVPAAAADGLAVPAWAPPEGKVTITDTARLHSSFTYLRKLQNRTSLVHLETEPLRNQLVADILLLCELERLTADGSRQHPDPLMKQAMSYIRQRALTPEISMQQAAKRLGLYPSQLTRRFRAVYGSTPTAYLTKLRLEEAKRLLIETNETVEAIAERCGYESGSYFCRVFTDKIGINPSSFRQNNWI